jgi:hypothetical protein
LRASLRRWKSQPTTAVAYRMRRRARYLGRWILHSGWYPDPKLRLYHRERARFTGAVHEALQVDGPTAWLEGELYHHTVNTLAEHVASVHRYTSLAAAQLFADGRRQWLLPMLMGSPWAFLRTLLFQQGFRDGYRGLQIAAMAAYYVFLKYRKLGILARGGSLEPQPGGGRS